MSVRVFLRFALKGVYMCVYYSCARLLVAFHQLNEFRMLHRLETTTIIAFDRHVQLS
jgi:hypothetical protein